MENECRTFYEMSMTGIRVDTPKAYSQGYQHFVDYMENRGWTFTERLYKDYELSTTYSISNKSNQAYCHHEWDRDLGEYQSMNLRNLLEELYKGKGLVDRDGNATPMCDHCEYSNECYSGCEDRKPNLEHPEWSHISIPWVGKDYYKNRIAVLGINPNEDGGLHQLDILIDAAKKELSEGHTKVNFGYVYESGEKEGKKYAGTFLWHRMAAYTKTINAALSCDIQDVVSSLDLMKPENFAPQNIFNEFDSMAYLNHIKCSPLGNRSIPTNKMWENCGSHILLEELKILRPEWLVVFGSGDNIWALEHHVFKDELPKPKTLECSNKVKYYGTNQLGFQMRILAVPHPAAPAGGADTSYYQYIYNIAQITKGTGWNKPWL